MGVSRWLESVPAAPFRIAGAACGGALLLASVLPNNAVLMLAAVCLLLFFLSWLLPRAHLRRIVSAGLALSALAFGLFGFRQLAVWEPLNAFDGIEVTVQGQIVEVYDSEENAYVVQVSGCPEGIPADTKMLIWLMEHDMGGETYDEITVRVRANKLKAHMRSWAGDGIFLTGTATEWSQCTAPVALPWYAVFGQARSALVDTVRKTLPGEEGALLCAVCLGDRSALSLETEANFRRAGLTHLMCVSGLHVSALAAVLSALLRPLGKRIRALGVIVCVWGFVALVGFSVSAIRAGVLITVLWLGQCLRVRADGLSSLGLALVLLMAVNPFCIFDVGLLLSFGACLGLMTVTPRLQEALPGAGCTVRPVRWVRDSLCVTFGASILVSPVLAFTFGEMYPLSPLSNLVAVFPATVMLLLGCAAMALAQVSFLAVAAEWLLHAAGWIAKGLLWFVDLMAGIPFASVPLTEDWVLAWVCGATAILVVGLCLCGWKGLRVAAACTALAFALGLTGQTVFMQGVCSVTAVDCGDCLAAIIRYRGQSAVLLVDGNNAAVRKVRIALADIGTAQADVLLYMRTGEAAAAGVAAEERLRLEALDNNAATLWEDMTLSSPADGWLCLTLGDTRMLVACKTAKTDELAVREADVLLCSGGLPLGATELTAQRAVIGCDRTTGVYLSRRISAWRFPCDITGEDGAVTVQFRASGGVIAKKA